MKLIPDHLPKWIKVIGFAESRKVAFGIWLFFMANIFLNRDKINAEVWIQCVFVAGALIGFGTIVDRIVDKLADKFIGKYGPPETPKVN